MDRKKKQKKNNLILCPLKVSSLSRLAEILSMNELLPRLRLSCDSWRDKVKVK